MLFTPSAAGVPFIAYDWGYVRSATADAGMYVSPDDDFADRALPVLRRWASDPDQLARESKKVRAAFGELLERSYDQLDDLLYLMRGGQPIA
jgi:hypothetical protein